MPRVFASEFKLTLAAAWTKNEDLNLEVTKLIKQVMKFLSHNFRNISVAALHEYQLVLGGKFSLKSRYNIIKSFESILR